MNQGVYFGQLVVGPAGSGKSTYCKILQDMGETLKRNIIVINLDPAAEIFKYRCDIDVRDLITLDDVMEELKLGPNGGLLYCMEYLLENQDWLHDQLADIQMDDYVLFDCPGQIELYTHLEVIRKLVTLLQGIGFSVCSLYMLDTTFINENAKFTSGCLMALSTMVSLGLPHLTILTKCDLILDKDVIDQYLEYSEDIEDIPFEKNSKEDNFEDTIPKYKKKMSQEIIQKPIVQKENQQQTNLFDQKYKKLHNTIKGLICEFRLVSMRPLDITNEESIRAILADADMILQYGENLDVNEKNYEQAESYLEEQQQHFDAEF